MHESRSFIAGRFVLAANAMKFIEPPPIAIQPPNYVGDRALPPPIVPPIGRVDSEHDAAKYATPKIRRKLAALLTFLNFTKNLPSWLISLCVHVAVLLALALIPVLVESSRPFLLMLSSQPDGGGDQIDVAFDLPSGDDVAAEAINQMAMTVSKPTALEILPGVGPPPEFTLSSLQDALPAAISHGLTGRTGALKGTLLGIFGGTKQTEDAVHKGLEWLKRVQLKDGAWSLRRGITDGANDDDYVAATSMALLAFAGAGNTQLSGEYQQQVKLGLKKLIEWQKDSGAFDAGDNATSHSGAYAHAQATIALCELYGMTQDHEIKAAAQKAVDHAQMRQDPRLGGWRYRLREDSDLSVTGWYVMALTSARMAGISSDDAIRQRASDYLDMVSHENGSRYSYADYTRPELTMTAEGLLCRLYLGWSTTDPRIARGIQHLLADPISVDIKNRNYYYWYYATQTLHHVGNPMWERWNSVMREELPKLQVNTGREAGSWPPQGDDHSSTGGRLYATCFSIYCLEVYYRHLPLYKLKGEH